MDVACAKRMLMRLVIISAGILKPPVGHLRGEQFFLTPINAPTLLVKMTLPGDPCRHLPKVKGCFSTKPADPTEPAWNLSMAGAGHC
jgi:hypothetical protein